MKKYSVYLVLVGSLTANVIQMGSPGEPLHAAIQEH
ncbi:unnamed protein product, partial [marine sediment metagenome]